MERELFDKILKSAIEKLYTNDSFLLNPEYDINERTISHKLAVYINDFLIVNKQKYDVDIEYNRMSVDYSKDGIDVGNIVAKSINYEEHPQKESYVYPDIIIHKRNQSDNIGIIEIKMSWKNIRKKLDYEKIDQYLKELDYEHGVFIELHPTLEKTLVEYGPFKA